MEQNREGHTPILLDQRLTRIRTCWSRGWFLQRASDHHLRPQPSRCRGLLVAVVAFSSLPAFATTCIANDLGDAICALMNTRLGNLIEVIVLIHHAQPRRRSHRPRSASGFYTSQTAAHPCDCHHHWRIAAARTGP